MTKSDSRSEIIAGGNSDTHRVEKIITFYLTCKFLFICRINLKVPVRFFTWQITFENVNLKIISLCCVQHT